MNGPLPLHWKWSRIGSHATKVGSGVTPKGGSAVYVSDGVPLIRSQNVLRGRLDLSNVAHITKETHGAMQNSHVSNGDVLLNITGASIGRACVANGLDQANVNQHVCIIRLSDELIPEFVCQFLNSASGQRAIDLSEGGGSREGLNYEQVKALEVPTPPMNEQRRIADALAAWDRAIETAEALVAAKQRRTSALATPLVWNEDDSWVSLEEVLTSSSARVGPDLNPPIFSVSKEGLSPQQDRFNKRIASEDLSRHMLVLPGQLALSGLNFWLGSVAVSEEPGPICISPDYKVFDIGNAAVAAFFKYVVRSKQFRDLLISCSTERASIVRRNFNRELFLASEIPLPDPQSQSKRADLLATMHEDVRREQVRLDFLRCQKRGLMQKVLTGEWQLLSDASEQAA